jgi:hypothetical protein
VRHYKSIAEVEELAKDKMVKKTEGFTIVIIIAHFFVFCCNIELKFLTNEKEFQLRFNKTTNIMGCIPIKLIDIL